MYVRPSHVKPTHEGHDEKGSQTTLIMAVTKPSVRKNIKLPDQPVPMQLLLPALGKSQIMPKYAQTRASGKTPGGPTTHIQR